MKHGLSREKQAAQLDVYGGNHTLMPQPTAPNLLLRHMLHPFAFLCVLRFEGSGFSRISDGLLFYLPHSRE